MASEYKFDIEYCKIQALLKTFTAPVTINSAQSISDENNLRAIEDAIPLLPGSNLQRHLSDRVEHALLTSRELNKVKYIMYNYIVVIGKALERRFPELNFIVQNTAFLDPTMRSMQRPDMEALQCKFDTFWVWHQRSFFSIQNLWEKCYNWFPKSTL